MAEDTYPPTDMKTAYSGGSTPAPVDPLPNNCLSWASGVVGKFVKIAWKRDQNDNSSNAVWAPDTWAVRQVGFVSYEPWVCVAPAEGGAGAPVAWLRLAEVHAFETVPVPQGGDKK